MKLFYNLNLEETNPFKIARFNLIWRANYVLSILFVLIISAYIIQNNIPSVLLFIFALLITTGSLIFLYKTKKTAPIYFFIATLGIILPVLSANYMLEDNHYGNIVWIIVAICIAYFGLGAKIGKYYALAGIIGLAIHIYFFLNENTRLTRTLNLIDKTALTLEVSIAISMVFYIIYQYTNLYTLSEKKVMATNNELELQNTTIQKQNQEKEILLKEIHHRVKNNLQLVSSLLNLQSNSISDATVVSAIQEGQSRIKTMSILHHRLYQNDGDFSKLSFKEYTTDLINSIHTTYSNKKVNTEIDIKIENIHLDIDTAIPLGLIINELTTNAYKYALAEGGSLLVSITSIQNNEYKLHIKDSGKGMPFHIDFENINTLGLKLVKILSKQIKGNLSYFYDDGANFVITFIDKSISSEI